MTIIDDIVSSPKQHILLIASAGSGKTYTLTNVLAQKIERGDVNPLNERIIVFKGHRTVLFFKAQIRHGGLLRSRY